jgi:hypothetical protein
VNVDLTSSQCIQDGEDDEEQEEEPISKIDQHYNKKHHCTNFEITSYGAWGEEEVTIILLDPPSLYRPQLFVHRSPL